MVDSGLICQALLYLFTICKQEIVSNFKFHLLKAKPLCFSNTRKPCHGADLPENHDRRIHYQSSHMVRSFLTAYGKEKISV